MKRQEILVKVLKDGRTTTFERFALKTTRGVLNQYKKIGFTGLGELFFKDYRESDSIKFIRTPDDTGTNDYLLAEYTPAASSMRPSAQDIKKDSTP